MGEGKGGRTDETGKPSGKRLRERGWGIDGRRVENGKEESGIENSEE
jgi:hypothetical protein